MASHNQLLAHAAAVKIYRTNYQASQNGSIGITLNCHWFLPFSNDTLDHQAAQRALDFMFGWFMQPVTTGEYPLSMVSFVGNRLPKFTREQSKILTGSFDFIGVNYYTSNYAANIPHSNNDTSKSTYFKDTHVNLTRGDSGTEPYLTSHYQLLAHAAAKLYKTKYQVLCIIELF
ncbi:beta-glucosidase 12 [Lathyrus oleraceus]|uniref:beta-glucosidase 12 n=1 Tax=Pisum sativum TaxID=3888 RepID=UPI0021D39CA7|nr:beta-glucosidase 12-like [Pisum sativum]